MTHGHHAVDAKEPHVICQELSPLTLLLGRLGCPPDHSCPLKILDLGWRGHQAWLGAQET